MAWWWDDIGLGRGRVRLRRHGHAKQFPTARQILLTVAVGQQSVVPHSHEARGQHVHEEPADELDRLERHDPALAPVSIILPAEGDLVVRETDQATVADGRL